MAPRIARVGADNEVVDAQGIQQRDESPGDVVLGVHDVDTILIAGPEMAVADTLYFAYLKREPVNDRLSLGRVNRRLVRRHLERFENSRLLDWVRHDFTF